MKRLVLAAVGLALVVGTVFGGIIDDRFEGNASAAPCDPSAPNPPRKCQSPTPTETATAIVTPTQTPTVTPTPTPITVHTYTVEATVIDPNAQPTVFEAFCDPGDVIGGGGFRNYSGGTLSSYPIGAIGWRAESLRTVEGVVFAVCIDNPPAR